MEDNMNIPQKIEKRASKMRDMEKDKERNPEKPSSSEASLGAKHRLTEECQETGKEQERPHETVNKFAILRTA